MARLIISIILFLVLAVFVVINVPYKTTINLFGLVIQDVSVVAVVLMSLVTGILYSFATYLINYLVKLRKQKLKKAHELNREKEKQLVEREKQLKSSPQQAALPDEPRADRESESKRGKKR